MNRETDPLSEALHERAETLQDAPVTLDAVRDRAGGIRRRRRVTAGVGALAVLAVLAPVGVATLGGGDGEDVPAASDATGPVAPDPVGRVEFTGRGLGQGAAPEVPYVDGDQRVVVGQSSVSPRGVAQPFDAAPLPDGLVVAGADAQGRWTVAVLGGEGSTAPAPVPDAVASSAERQQVAWVQGDQDAQEVRVAGTGSVEEVEAARGLALPIEDGDPTGWRPVGIGPDGVVLEDVEGARGSVVLADPGGGVRAVPGLLRAGGVDEASGRIAGLTSASDDGSCSAVVGTDGSTAWETCDYTLLGFSPDGRWVLATLPYRSGFGDTTTAVLDAETGELQAEWRAADPEQSATWISRRWEDEDTFVAVVVAGNEVSLVRFDVDGSTEYAAGPVTVADPTVDMPFVLPGD